MQKGGGGIRGTGGLFEIDFYLSNNFFEFDNYNDSAFSILH